MNLLRSPPRSVFEAERSGSVPELSSEKLYSEAPERKQITFRNKRKQIDDNEQLKHEISEMRTQMSEMMTYLKSINTAQSENLNKLCLDVTAIKEQVNAISHTVEHLSTEQNKMKSDLANVSQNHQISIQRIEHLEQDIQQLKSSNMSLATAVQPVCENIMAEINERNQRSKNIIMLGVPEPIANTQTERNVIDKTVAISHIKAVSTDYPDPEKVIRLGKYKQDKNRPLKICFSSQSTATSILKNKINIKNASIKIVSDRTPYQQIHMKNVKEELTERTKNGEENLTIKYIKGMPKIVQVPPKNDKTLLKIDTRPQGTQSNTN